LAIEHEIVITANRYEIPLDPTFESWNFLDKYLIYLPGGDIYIDPANDLYRIGVFEGNLSGTHGLFVSRVRLGSFESAIGKIRYIQPTPYNANYDNMNIEIFMDVDKGEARIINTRGFKGLSGGSLGRIYKRVDKERKESLLKNLMETRAPNPDFKTLKVLYSSNIDFIRDADFIIHSDFTSESLLEIAGNRLLLSLGECIGPQIELYFDEEREIGGVSGFNRWYHRRIVVNVPEGFRIINPQAADMKVLAGGEETDAVYGFVSTYNYSDNLYTIDIDEYYKEVEVDPAGFEGFRSVINAAADFNKVVLVLERM
jgi:hypothetical protein